MKLSKSMKVIQTKKFKDGPRVNAQFFLNESGIEKITLSSSTSDAFEWHCFASSENPQCIESIEEWMSSFCQRRQPTVRLPILLKGLPLYTTQVLSLLHRVPFGVTTTYQSLAEDTGKPKAARAVGNACGRNPFPLVIPCHRVLAQGQRIGGFSCGLDVKTALLDFEKIEYSIP